MIQAEVKKLEPVTVAYLPMRGPYRQMPEAFGTVYGWIETHGLTPGGMPVGVFYTDPESTPEEHAVWELQAPLTGENADAQPDESGVGIKTLPERTMAVTMYKGPYSEMSSTYLELGNWIAELGYTVSGPPEEAYYSDPATTSAEEYLTEIRFPVTKG